MQCKRYLYSTQLAATGSQVQRSGAINVSAVDVGSLVEATTVGRVVSGALLVQQHIEGATEEALQNTCMALLRCNVKRVAALLCGNVAVRAVAHDKGQLWQGGGSQHRG